MNPTSPTAPADPQPPRLEGWYLARPGYPDVLLVLEAGLHVRSLVEKITMQSPETPLRLRQICNGEFELGTDNPRPSTSFAAVAPDTELFSVDVTDTNTITPRTCRAWYVTDSGKPSRLLLTSEDIGIDYAREMVTRFSPAAKITPADQAAYAVRQIHLSHFSDGRAVDERGCYVCAPPELPTPP